MHIESEAGIEVRARIPASRLVRRSRLDWSDVNEQLHPPVPEEDLNDSKARAGTVPAEARLMMRGDAETEDGA